MAPDFNTPDRIIRFAMQNAALLADGADPTPEQYAKYFPRLQDLVNLLQTKGIKLWLNSILPVTLIAGTGVYALTGQPKRVLEAYYFDNSTPANSRPLNVMSWNTYNTLSAQAAQGPVNSYFVDKGLNATNLYLWMIPDTTAATGSVKCLVQNATATMNALNDTIAFPSEWFSALHWALGSEISVGQPDPIVAKCERMAAQYLTALEGWDVEDAPVQFQPDMVQRRPSSFR